MSPMTQESSIAAEPRDELLRGGDRCSGGLPLAQALEAMSGSFAYAARLGSERATGDASERRRAILGARIEAKPVGEGRDELFVHRCAVVAASHAHSPSSLEREPARAGDRR